MMTVTVDFGPDDPVWFIDQDLKIYKGIVLQVNITLYNDNDDNSQQNVTYLIKSCDDLIFNIADVHAYTSFDDASDALELLIDSTC